jgi:diguanylate cyclase (GGDEF)-like protein
MTELACSGLLNEIDAALAARTAWLTIPRSLCADYRAGQLASRRPHNRHVVIWLILLFDLFWIGQFSSAPELVVLSGIFRFGLLTPLVLLFLWVDRRDRLGRFYEAALLAVAVAPALITAVLCVRTTSSTTMSDVRATPLILLTTGLVGRLTVAGAVTNTVVSAAAFIGSIIASHTIPRAELGSLILTDLCIAAACVGFNLQMEIRDRRVFLLQTADAIRRAELAAQNVGLRLETQTDALTGVANRRCFDETLAAAWDRARSASEWMGLIMIDVDHFKLFNDHYGHQAGDDCLRIVAEQARNELRSGDVMARYGGEEFAVILPGKTLIAVSEAAERIRASIEGLALRHGGIGPAARVTVSLGATSLVPAEGQDMRRLIETADQNLYEAKRAGRNRVGTGGEEPAKSGPRLVGL